MIKLLQRTEIRKLANRYLYQQADIGRLVAPYDGYPWTPTRSYNCFFCRYKQTFNTYADYETCVFKHACNHSMYPIIDMSRTINAESGEEITNPDGTLLTYQHTGIYKQWPMSVQCCMLVPRMAIGQQTHLATVWCIQTLSE